MIQLNEDQEKAKQEIFTFLGDTKQQCYCLMGAAGCGKTTVIKYFEKALEEYNATCKTFHLPEWNKVIFTATTNKASTLLGYDARTIHSILGLKVSNNIKTGKTKLIRSGVLKSYNRHIFVIDEASMIDDELMQYILSGLGNNKIIFLLDPFQLPPINLDNSLVDKKGYPSSLLTQPMRQDAHTHLYEMCQLMRKGVEDQTYYKLSEGKGVRFVDENVFVKEILETFKKPSANAKVLAYSNERIEEFNTFIRKQTKGNNQIKTKDLVVCRSSGHDINKTVNNHLKVEAIYEVQDVDYSLEHYYGVPVNRIQLSNHWYYIPRDKRDFFKKIKQEASAAKQLKRWDRYFAMQQGILDIRDTYACTVHSSQGSTYDKVFLDFANLCKCRDINIFTRMLYVAISRARKEIIICGI